MKTYYLDTNVFLARYAPEEKEHDSSKILLEATEAGQLKALTSPLTLVEIASTVRRSSEKLTGTMPPVENSGAFVRRALALRNLGYISLGGEMTLAAGSPVKVPLLFTAALKAVRSLPMKTLNLLHLASAYMAVRLFGEDLDFFATLDDELLRFRREVKDFLGCSAVTPSELVKLEGL